MSGHEHSREPVEQTIEVSTFPVESGFGRVDRCLHIAAMKGVVGMWPSRDCGDGVRPVKPR